jgi:hypothetical protein
MVMAASGRVVTRPSAVRLAALIVFLAVAFVVIALIGSISLGGAAAS